MTKSTGTYISRGKQKYQIVRNLDTIDIDNGSGTTADYLLLYAPDDIILVDAHVVYVTATDTTGAAAATVSIGTTVGGIDIVAASALEAAKAIGAVTKLTLAATSVAAGSTMFIRHTGIASTEVGSYYVQLRYFYR